jgi:hypothetical protein
VDSSPATQRRHVSLFTGHNRSPGGKSSFNACIRVALTIAQSHTGAALALAFQAMLMRFSLTDKILAMNADNASSNDTQTTELAGMDNAFEKEYRIRCFNHTIQLSAKALLRPFNAGIKVANDGDNDLAAAVEEMALDHFDEEEDEDEEDDDGIDWNAEDFDDGVDELDQLPANEREKVVAETATIRETITKVRHPWMALVSPGA